MKPELAFRLAEGIQLLHHDDCDNYTDRLLADISGVSTSTIKRNKDLVKMLDIALRFSDIDNEQLQ